MKFIKCVMLVCPFRPLVLIVPDSGISSASLGRLAFLFCLRSDWLFLGLDDMICFATGELTKVDPPRRCLSPAERLLAPKDCEGTGI